MRVAAAARRAELVMTAIFLAAGTTIGIPGCAVPAAHNSTGRPATARRAPAARPSSGTHHRTASSSPAAHRASPRSGSGAALATALAPALRNNQGRLAVGVIDPATGRAAAYHASWPFDTASIIKADILAVLLIQHQQARTPLSPTQRQLATKMIEDSDNTAATTLWNAVEGGPGVEAGNAALGLRHTWPAITGAWGLTTTTVADQLRLLTDLTSAHSPLDETSRTYELTLMRHVQPGQDWGVTAAADPATHPAVKNGWLPAGPHRQWVINSIGVVTHAAHRLLIAVLSDGQPTQDDGIRQAQAAARAAASAITAPP